MSQPRLRSVPMPEAVQSAIRSPTRRLAPVYAGPSPYLDYSRQFTAEGGIAITYKDIDDRIRHLLWRAPLWLTINGLCLEYVRHGSTLNSPLIHAVLLIAVGVISWLILWRPIEVLRTVEVRPDCMIIDHTDVFWRHYFELGFPQFQAQADGRMMLCGIYGTRFVEFFTIRSFDDNDRAPHLFASHLTGAMQQLWTTSY